MINRQLDPLHTFTHGRPPSSWRRVPHVVIVAGGKGGVGASTASALLAIGAARAGRATLLVDAAAGPASVVDVLGAHAPRTDAVETELRTVAAHLTLAFVPPPHVLAAGERRAALRRLSGRYDEHELVVIDAGATCDGMFAALAAGAGRLLAVTNSDRLSLIATYALIKTAFGRFPGLPVSVLVNGCEPAEAVAAFGHIATATEHFLATQVTPAGSIPADDQLRNAINAGVSPIDADGPAAHAAGLLAELLLHAGPGRRVRPVALQAKT
jgi:MinD-like ATPase involved in chromosome partitioning or flagellar assembly